MTRPSAERVEEIRERHRYAAVCVAEGVGGDFNEMERERRDLLAEIDALRAELSEAELAAIRAQTMSRAAVEQTRVENARREAVVAAQPALLLAVAEATKAAAVNRVQARHGWSSAKDIADIDCAAIVAAKVGT